MAERRSPTGYAGVGINRHGTVTIRVPKDGKWVTRTVNCSPTQAGFKAAARTRKDIIDSYRLGTLRWEDYFPDEVTKYSGPLDVPRVPTWGEMADQWIPIAESQLSPSTIAGYKKWIRNVWRPALGSKIIDRILTSDIRKIIAVQGWRNPKTIGNALTPCRRVFELAVSDRVISMDPTRDVDPGKYQRPPADAYSKDERDEILEAFDLEPDWKPYFQTAFGSGMRTSELNGLKWPGVMFNQSIIRVQNARVEATDRNRTKTSTYRDIPLFPLAEQALKFQQLKTRMLDKGGYVFLHPGTEDPIASDQEPRRAWNRVLAARPDIRRLVPYSTRHTFATINLSAGVDLQAVSRWLGHASVKMTLDHYAAWLESRESAEIERARETQR